ncbi:MAG TPA: hypothetical protein VH092_09640 [Urbifossiella sp.]|jgi:hypothetical protein|nr:hypothetical protein [Urbifossiella sp.]
MPPAAIRFASRAAVAVAVLTALAGPGVAADSPKVVITSARIGLPAAATEAPPVAKFAAWAPVYVDLQVLEAVPEPAELVVESPDADGVTTVLAVPLDLTAARPGTTVAARELPRFPYVRPAAGAADTTVSVRLKGVPISAPFRVSSLRPKDALTYVVLGLGSRLPAFDLPRAAAGEGDAPPTTAPLRGGRVEAAAIADLELLPDHWVGYDAADLVVLTTASGDLFEKLFSPAGDRKRAALLEWVRRGGRLVVSVGEKGKLLQLPAVREFLPAGVKDAEPVRTVNRLPLYWSARESSQTSTMSGNLTTRGAGFPVANLEPSRPGRVLIPPPSRQADEKDVVAAQSGFGLGRVTVIGFDLDRPPFTEFTSRAEFWDWVLREGGASRASVGSEGKPRPFSSGPTDDEDELAVALRTHVDTFDGVPVISFGWVAVLIAFYLVLVGPVEFYVLKRVLGRLELTWGTFPVIVVTVFVLAYLSADAVKGRDLRVNTVEVIDVVPGAGGGRVYGTGWYGVFSPRIDTYAVGVTPAEKWAVAGAGGDPVLGWVGGPRGGRASLLRRRYEVHTGPGEVADGLVGVPIQVWSTRAFGGNWSAPLDPAAPVVESRLEHPPGDPTKAIGTFVTRMPVPELTDAVAFYAGQAYPLGTLVPDEEVRLVLDRGLPATQFLQEKGGLADLLARAAPDRSPAGQKPGAPAPAAPEQGLPLWGLLFHEAALRNDEGVIPRNASVRRLDQSWRLSPENRGEVIVVARAPVASGRADDLTGGPWSASRLWLKALPGAGPRPAVPGIGRTETYVRLYLPVK